ncbi:hypothetical protein BRARA_A03761 [Brassica rapa]|uniref:DUF4283 domain-containing protein n=2 Tax=Brassica TaxID=3705 RepID=A0A398AZX5_BRACM|nr:hypothetical protein BRARA_A03761 [Brassica rapa]
MHSVWKVPGLPSGVNPPVFAPGEPPPSLPPDPPDPSSPLSSGNFPSLSEASLKTASAGSRKGTRKNLIQSSTNASPTEKKQEITTCSDIIPMEMEQQNSTLSTGGTVPILRSEIATVHLRTSEPNLNQIYETLPLRESSPILSNKACTTTQTQPQKTLHVNPTPPSTNPETKNGTVPAPKQTLVEKLRASADMSLKRLAPATLAPSGRPRVVIPDSVFKKGAEIHQDFIICYFNGKSPPFNQIQSVFNYMWGKGKRLEIHNNPLNRNVIVRIQSAYLRQKILEKNIWYVGDSMFHTAQWNSNHSMSTPPLKAIQIWAHLTGVPLDLRYDEGLSLVAGLVGEPKETDEFTKNMVSLTVSHVKVEVDLTLPLPPVVEFERESGEVVEVQVHYPWVPPTCSHCHELGHILRNCLTYTPPVSEKEKEKGKEKASTSKHNETPKPYKTTKNTNPPPSDFTPSKASRNNQKRYQAVSKTPSEKTQITVPVPQEPPEIVPSLPSSSLFQQSPSPPPDPSNSHAASNIFSSPDPTPRPSLKRSRSSPILSPPESASANPFSELQTLTFSGLPPLTLTFPTPFPVATDLSSQKTLPSFDSRGPLLPEDPPPNPSL